ncbi:MAG TPA: alpha-amylase family protein [archaeon]|nr:alpha-amylase family protein [archaeon]
MYKIRLLSHAYLLLITFAAVSSLCPRTVQANAELKYLPSKEQVEQVVLENDFVRYTFEIKRQVKLKSLIDKTTGQDFMKCNPPLTFCDVSGQGRWDNESEYHLFAFSDRVTENGVSVSISQQAGSYVQNPLVVSQIFSLEAGPELIWEAKVLNTSAAGRDHPEARAITSSVSFPLMQKIKVGDISRMHYFIPGNGARYCIDSPNEFIFYFTGSPSGMPIDIYNLQENRGIYFHVLKSSCALNFSDKNDFISKVFNLRFDPGEEKQIIACRICAHQGDWHQALQAFKKYIRSSFDFTYYNRPGHLKYRQSFVSHFTFLLGHDIYDPENNRFRIHEFFEEAEMNFGGFDNMILWHNYPRLGVDYRDQFDLLEDMPGGLDGLTALVDSAHARGMLVFISYNPWDTMNRDKDHVKELVRVCKTTRMDGIYLDTMHGLDQRMRDALDEVSPDIIFSSEGRASISSARLLTGSWEQADDGPAIMPNVDLLRFVLPEHMVHNTNRVAVEKAELIYNALFNGTGLTIWEDMFGNINEFSWNDRVIVKRYNRIIHENRDAYLTLEPVPLVPTLRKDFYVNAFPIAEKCVYAGYQTGREEVLYAYYNQMKGPYIEVEHPENWHYVDLWSHRDLPAERINGKTRLIFPIQPTEPMFCIAAMPENLRVVRDEGTLRVETRLPSANTSIQINTVDNLTMIEEEVLKLPGNGGTVDISRLDLDYPYKVLIKLMQGDVLKDEVVLNLGWKKF